MAASKKFKAKLLEKKKGVVTPSPVPWLLTDESADPTQNRPGKSFCQCKKSGRAFGSKCDRGTDRATSSCSPHHKARGGREHGKTGRKISILLMLQLS